MAHSAWSRKVGTGFWKRSCASKTMGRSWHQCQASMSDSAQLGFDALNAALKAAGEETRLRVLALLSEAELTVSDLTDILRQSQPRISRHLKLLAEAGL